MTITGNNLIGNTLSATGSEIFAAVNPSTGALLPGQFHLVTVAEATAVTAKATAAFKLYNKKSIEDRAVFLETIAEEILAAGDELLDRAMAESGLPAARLTGERGRTMMQLKMFAQLLREGSWVDARIDTAIPDRQPLPKPDLRSMLTPLGPVMVFGASNFPFAYSAAGGDTASALAAGCPVIVKAHPLHPGTDEMVGQAIISAAKKTNMPDGVFSLVFSNETTAIQLVKDPAIKAIGFTGSRKGGMAIFDAAVNRAEPIPVYAEMSAVNPVILLPGAVAANAAGIAQGFAASVCMGVGQFCTNPGLVFMVDDDNTKIFLRSLSENIEKITPATMLSKGIYTACNNGVEQLKAAATLATESKAIPDTGKTEAVPHIFSVAQKDFMANKSLSQEVFGPVSLVVLCKNTDEICEALQGLEGQLTATVHANADDEAYLSPVIDLMKEKAGRVLFGGFPTGVEVCDAMVHGGPFPATTDSRTTSVGTAAILRFVRPVAYQNFPQPLLPEALKDNNPLKILRIVNGSYSRETV
ncbi:aldehyde dehydrogenase (NADP(+)) [Ferruginibacter sp. SUN106]|uniref:aldehyde dehydrogenase (NADP(+)) n=1 Tax=Ferruginibacter sp. SUN106 TaxID=2978348 RepID=UPI003D364DE9